jgi:DNA recombination protein RmuC
MEAASVLIGILVLVGLVIVGLQIFMLMRMGKKGDDNSFILLQQQLNEFSRMVDGKVEKMGKEVHESMYKQASDSQKLIKDITEEITSVKELGRQTATFAEQLKSLQDVLKNPKQRGVLGEYYLETVLKNVLPPGMYQMQYGFKDREVVDAVVFVKDKVIPIDSKFSLENYNRFVNAAEQDKDSYEKAFVNDLKLRISETAKYIRPDEGTMDFAFMFIPSEGIYYDLLVNSVGGGEENLIQRAAAKHKVIIVSPTSFLAYLQTVLQGLNALQIEQRATEIQKRVEELGKHLKKYDEFYHKLGNTLSTTVSHYNNGYKELKKVDKDIYRISEYSIDIEPEELSKPQLED